MNADAQTPKRPYKSRLRDRQAKETRTRILEAFSEQMVDSGTKDFSIDQVARRAGVSSRTVYHHFPNREDLFDAVTSWLAEQAMGEQLADAPTLEELVSHIGMAFETFDRHESLIRAQLLTELGRAVRQRDRSRRRPAIESMVRREAPNLTADEARRATALIHYLGSSEAWRSMKDESGMSGLEAGQTVIWAIRALLTDLRSKDGGPKES